MKKVQIHEFDPIIYPFKLWISCTSNYEALNDRFYYSNRKDLNPNPIYENEGVCYYVKERCKGGHYGCLVVFTERRYFNIKNMVHEGAHVVDYLWEHIAEDTPGQEANAYFSGWVAECMDVAKKFKKK